MRLRLALFCSFLLAACQGPAHEPYAELCRPAGLDEVSLHIAEMEVAPHRLSARLHHDEATGAYGVAIQLQQADAARLAQMTRERLGEPLDIALGEKVVTSPVVQTPILDGSILMTGGFTRVRAETIVQRLSPPCPETQPPVVAPEPPPEEAAETEPDSRPAPS